MNKKVLFIATILLLLNIIFLHHSQTINANSPLSYDLPMDNDISNVSVLNINYNNYNKILKFQLKSNKFKSGYFGRISGQLINKDKEGVTSTWEINNSQITDIFFEESGKQIKVGELSEKGHIIFNDIIENYSDVTLNIESKLWLASAYHPWNSSFSYTAKFMINNQEKGTFNITRNAILLKPNYTERIKSEPVLRNNVMLGGEFKNAVFAEFWWYPVNFNSIAGRKFVIRKDKFDKIYNYKTGKEIKDGDEIDVSLINNKTLTYDVNPEYSWTYLSESLKSIVKLNSIKNQWEIILPEFVNDKNASHIYFNLYISSPFELMPTKYLTIDLYKNGSNIDTKTALISNVGAIADGNGIKPIKPSTSDGSTQTDSSVLNDSSTQTDDLIVNDEFTQVDITKNPIIIKNEKNFETGITEIIGKSEPNSLIIIKSLNNKYVVETNDSGEFKVEIPGLNKDEELLFIAQKEGKLDSDTVLSTVIEKSNSSVQTDNPILNDSSTQTDSPILNDSSTQTDSPKVDNKIPSMPSVPSKPTLPKTGVGTKKDIETEIKYAADARQFITFQTKNGKTFHLVINHDEENNNVMLLTEVSEDDLLNMVEKKEIPKKVVEEQPKKVEKEPVKTENKSELGTYLVIGVIAVIGVIGAYFFKKYKKEEADNLASFEENDNELEEIDEIDIYDKN